MGHAPQHAAPNPVHPLHVLLVVEAQVLLLVVVEVVLLLLGHRCPAP
jgi:hypothetical protein